MTTWVKPNVSIPIQCKLPQGSSVEFWISHGIPSKNTTHVKLGQTTLMFTNRTKPSVEDDPLEASIKHLKFKRFNP